MSLRVLLPIVVLAASAIQAQHAPPVPGKVKNDGSPRQTDGPIPLPAADETWLRARSKHFVFISSMDEKRTRAVAAELETLASALTRIDSTFSAVSAAPRRVILFARRRESQAYFEMLLNRRDPETTSVFVSQRNGGAMLINQESMLLNPDYRRRGGDRTPLRELVRDLVQSGHAHMPRWLEEGIAEYFSNVTIRPGSIAAGPPISKHVITLAHRTRIPPGELFNAATESDVGEDTERQAVISAESWAIVDWLFLTSRGNVAAFQAFVHDLSHDVPVEAALLSHYHCSLRDVDWAISRYSSRYSSPHGSAWVITIPAQAIDSPVVIESIDRASTLYDLGHLLSALEELSADAERHFRAALDANPRHARSLAALATLLCAAGKDAEAMPLFERGITADPNDVEVALAYAEALMQDQIVGAQGPSSDTRGDDITRFRRARSLVQRSLTHRGDAGFPAGRAMGDLGMTYGVENDVSPGIIPLEEACKLLPDRTDFALELLAMYRRSDNRAKADSLFAQLESEHKPQVSSAARAAIEGAELIRANALTREQRLDEAADVVHQLAATTSDASARLEFEKQAAELTGVAARSRQIDAYNKIVAQVNAGEYREANKALADLLHTASDADIVRDAKELQKQLATWKP